MGLPAATPQTAPIRIPAIQKNPPAIGFRVAMHPPMAEQGRVLQPRRIFMVNEQLTSIVGYRERASRLTEAMDSPFIAGRLALAEASDLIDRFGDDAGLEAAARAEHSRDVVGLGYRSCEESGKAQILRPIEQDAEGWISVSACPADLLVILVR